MVATARRRWYNQGTGPTIGPVSAGGRMTPRRYLVPFAPKATAHRFTDVLVVGAGIAGLRPALAVPPPLDKPPTSPSGTTPLPSTCSPTTAGASGQWWTGPGPAVSWSGPSR